MNYNGFVWWSKNKTEKGTNYYACSRKGCPATLTVTIDLQYRERGKHSTECLAEKMKKQKQNLLNEFQEEILKQTLNFYKTPSQIYLEVKEKMIKKSEDTNLPISFPSQNSIINQISKERKLHFPYDLIFMLTEPPFSLTDDGLIFWRGSNSIMIGNKKESFIIWTTDKLSGLLLQNSQSFFDGTFLIAPKPFKQLLVIMGFDSETETYYPCIYALLTGKQMELYVQCFEYIKNTLLQNKWNPKFITCDFERSLLTAICKVFPTSKLVGCYFHFKQALQRWCTKRGLMNESMKSSTGSLLLEIEVLTLIEPNLIIPTIKTLESKYPNQSLFWNYFKHTWLSIFPPNLWNIHFFKGIVQRTNNPLLMEFLQVIKEEDNKWRKKLDENRDSRSQKQLNIYPLDPNSLTYQWLEKVDLKLEFEYMLEEKFINWKPNFKFNSKINKRYRL
ncbi:hypothetical protein M0811_00365 [Anaeramoeba ignava]|uniref:MULE transposase domain-containing protein n=1 Tax=Anaeramoeba ignava TaxID=1746090 RepID=A0A9Q0LTL4_ANAIG|nr:hypothetical protein M0811_00365 [Anaeramoeba ignava]